MRDAESDLITTTALAGALGVSVRTIHRMVASGALPVAFKLPGATGAYLFERAIVTYPGVDHRGDR